MVRDLLQLNNTQKRLFVVLAGALCCVLFLYGALVKQTVANVVGRKSVESDAADLASRVAGLEAEYLAAAETLTLETALSRGFVEAKPALFVSRAPAALSFGGGTQ